MPKLSIIVPIYNVEADLPKCIESILAQNYKDFELILINDGSPDNCMQIIEQYKQKDPRIISIHQKNKGVSAARNAGLSIATGEYIGFIDADCWIDEKMYSQMVSFAEMNKLDIVCCNWSEDGIEHPCAINSYEILSSEDFYFHLFDIPRTFSDCIWNKLFSLDFLRNIKCDRNVRQTEDYLFLCDLYKANRKMGYIPKSLYYVYTRPNSATNSGTWKRLQALDVRDRVVDKFKQIDKKLYKSSIKECLDLATRFKNNLINENSSPSYINYTDEFISKFISKNIFSILFNNNLHWKLKLNYLKRLFILKK